jgi:hypothetical protein
MRFGEAVVVTRGGRARPGTPGCSREVRGVLVDASGSERTVRLTEDDPLSTIAEWSKAGDIGRWSASAVRHLNARDERTEKKRRVILRA